MSEGKPFKKCIFFIVGPDDGGKIKVYINGVVMTLVG